MFKHAIAVASLMAAVLSSGQAAAATATADFQVKLTITAACSVVAGTASDINLGSHASTESNIANSNNIKVTCTKNTPYTIGLAPSNGNATGAGVMTRTTTPTDTVAYQLYSDSNHATVWGNNAAVGVVANGVGDTGTGAEKSHMVYAVVPSANSSAGNYVDTVTVTVNY